MMIGIANSICRGQCAPASTPLTLFPGVVSAWLTSDYGLYQETTGASATTPAATDSDPVGTWVARRSSGGNLYYTAPGASSRASYKLAVQNSRPTIRFDGVNDYLKATFASDLSQPAVVAAVVKYESDTGFAMLYDSIDATKRWLVDFNSPNISMGAGGGYRVNFGTTQVSTFQLLIAEYNGASSRGWKNGGSPTTGDMGAQPISGHTLSALYYGAGAKPNDFAEMLILSGTLSAADLTALRTYFNSRWAVY